MLRLAVTAKNNDQADVHVGGADCKQYINIVYMFVETERIWCIILTVVQYSSRYSGFEGGPKNPLKGTSMKFLVLATDAQLGADAGS
jgi:hypothetical protein